MISGKPHKLDQRGIEVDETDRTLANLLALAGVPVGNLPGASMISGVRVVCSQSADFADLLFADVVAVIAPKDNNRVVSMATLCQCIEDMTRRRHQRTNRLRGSPGQLPSICRSHGCV